MSLTDRLAGGAPLLCAEGYLFELERRGYLQAGPFVPEILLERPEIVAQLHRDYVHAGSDVVLALTYYAHREKLQAIGRQHDLEAINRQALALATQVADESAHVGERPLVAGNLCNTNIWAPERRADVRAMFDEQLAWAVEAGVDYVVAETFSWLGEALEAVDAAKAAGVEVAVTLTIHRDPVTRDGWEPVAACAELAERGAEVVGFNCGRGPATLLPLAASAAATLATPVAALPVPYRTTEEQPSMQALRDPQRPGERPFPSGLDPFTCTRADIAEFTRAAQEQAVRYLGLCCGAAPHHVRAMAEALGRQPPAARFEADMSRHVYLGAQAREADWAYAQTY